jgi:prevent-host-death family protein
MREVTASEFSKAIGQYQNVAQREPVCIVNHGRPTAYLISADEYQKFQAIRAEARKHLQVGSLPKNIVAAIKAAKVGPKHKHLDKLLDD